MLDTAIEDSSTFLKSAEPSTGAEEGLLVDDGLLILPADELEPAESGSNSFANNKLLPLEEASFLLGTTVTSADSIDDPEALCLSLLRLPVVVTAVIGAASARPLDGNPPATSVFFSILKEGYSIRQKKFLSEIYGVKNYWYDQSYILVIQVLTKYLS